MAKRKSTSTGSVQAKSKIEAAPLRLEWIDPKTLTANPLNWRTHPAGQMAALSEVLADPEVGWAGVLLFNEETGHLIDGHARQKAAIERGDEAVPVVIGRWSLTAEKKILLSHDPLGGMAEFDPVKLQELLDEVPMDSEGLSALADGLVAMMEEDADAETRGHGDAESGEGGGGGEGVAGERWSVVITCRSEREQLKLLKRFSGEGLRVKALTV